MRFTKPTGITLLFLVAFCVTFSAVAQAPAAPPAPAAAPPAAKPAPATPPATPAVPPAPPEKTFDKAQTSYALGVFMGERLSGLSSSDIDVNNFTKGFSEKIDGKTPTMPEADIKQALMGLSKAIMARQIETNKGEETKYLAENGKKEGVTTLPSGLQYKVVKEGTGPKPTAADTVKVEYKGTFVDGKEFDSSAKQGKPATLPVSGVIKGWTEALQLMPVGSTWQLAIPSSLAYGEQGRPGMMPPAKMLLFDITLVEILPKAPAAQPGAVTLPNPTPGQRKVTDGAPAEGAKPVEPAKGSS